MKNALDVNNKGNKPTKKREFIFMEMEKVKRTSGAPTGTPSGKRTFLRAMLITFGCMALIMLGFALASLINAYVMPLFV